MPALFLSYLCLSENLINLILGMNKISFDGQQRKNIQIGDEVEIVQKHHQRTGELTDGIVKRILTKSASHPHGIKVMLETGEVGRVKNVIPE